MVNVVNLILIIIAVTLQLMGFNPHGSIITSSCMSLYASYLIFSAQLSNSEDCNELLDSKATVAF